MPKKLFIFDLDGTLIDSKEDIADSVNALLKHFGKPEKSLKEIQTFVGHGVISLLKKSLSNPNEEEIKNSVLPVFEDIYSKNLTKKTKLYPGVQFFLERLSSKTQKVGVLTHKPKKFSISILENLKIDKHIFMCLGGDELQQKKPHPEGLLRIMKSAGNSSEETVFMGDSQEDILAGKAAFVTTIAATYGFRPPEELILCKPDHIINSFQEILNLRIT